MEHEPVNKLTDKPMTPEFIDLMGLMGRMKDAVLDEAKMQWYWNTLHKYPLIRISHGINSHYADPIEGKFVPSPGQIVANMPSTTKEWPGLKETPPPASSRRLRPMYDSTLSKEERLRHIKAMLALPDEELVHENVTRPGLLFLQEILSDLSTSEDEHRNRVRKRAGLEPLFPNPERDKLRADYEAAKQSGDMATAQALVAQLVADLPETADTTPAWAGEGMMSYEEATAYQEQYGGGPAKKGKRQTRKGGAAQR